MDAREVDRALNLDADRAREARTAWLALMDLAVWGDLRASRVGAVPKLRKRALETGERMKSMFSSRDWIPHARERLKNALASFLNLRQSLCELDRAAAALDAGADLTAFHHLCTELNTIAEGLSPAAQRWSQLLDSQYGADDA